MKKPLIAVAAMLVLFSGTSFAKRIIVDDGFGPVIYKTHHAHYYYPAGPGFYYVTKQPKHVYMDPYGHYMVVHRPHHFVRYQPATVFHFSF